MQGVAVELQARQQNGSEHGEGGEDRQHRLVDPEQPPLQSIGGSQAARCWMPMGDGQDGVT